MNSFKDQNSIKSESEAIASLASWVKQKAARREGAFLRELLWRTTTNLNHKPRTHQASESRWILRRQKNKRLLDISKPLQQESNYWCYPALNYYTITVHDWFKGDKTTYSRSVVSDSLWPRKLWPSRLPWRSKNKAKKHARNKTKEHWHIPWALATYT